MRRLNGLGPTEHSALRVFVIGAVYCVVCWLGAVMLGFPRTYWDDSLIVGPAIGIVETRHLINIYLSKNFYQGEQYLFYPPIFFWVLAGWISGFSRSVNSLAIFWATCGAVASVSVALLLKRLARTTRIAWLVSPVLVFGCVAYTGYRVETLGLATLSAGLAVAVHGRRLPGYFLLFLTPTIAPTFLAISAVAIAALFVVEARNRLSRELLLAAAMFVAVSLLLIASVSGQIGELIATMYQYRDVRIGIGGQIGLSGRNLEAAAINIFPIAVNLSCAFCQRFVLKRPVRSIEVWFPLLVLLSLELTVFTHSRPTTMVIFNITSLVVAAITIGALFERWLELQEGRAASGMLVGVGFFLAILNWTYARDIALTPLPDALVVEARRAVAAAPSDRLLVVDPQVIKYALEYSTSRHIEDSMIRKAWPDAYQDYNNVPRDEYLIMTRSGLLSVLLPAERFPYRHRVDRMFIATGMRAAQKESICIIDGARPQRWANPDPRKLVTLACAPQTSVKS